MNFGMHRQEVRDRPALVRRLVVSNHMDLFAARLIDHNVGQEGDEFGRGVPRGRFAEHFAGLGVEGGVAPSPKTSLGPVGHSRNRSLRYLDGPVIFSVIEM